MIRVAVVGCGFMGQTHMEAYRALPNVELAAGVDKNEENKRKVRERFGVRVFSTMGPVLKDESIAIVDVCLPTHLHRKFVEKALAAGKHVLCEKPMALTVREAEHMAQAAEQSGRFLMVAQVLRFWPEYAKAKEIMDGGAMGRLLSMSCVRRSATPMWSVGSWLLEARCSGGFALDLHIHDTDWVLYCMGRPKAVASTGLKTERGWDQIFTNYYFESGAAASAEGTCGLAQSFPFRAGFTAVLEGGQIEFDSALTPSLRLYRNGASEAEYPEVPTLVSGTAAEGGNIEALGGYFAEVRYFVDCVERGVAPSIVTPADGVQAVEVALAEIRSAETGKMVKLR